MDKNTKTISIILFISAAMVGGAFASAPLYKKFCQLTGFAGTTQRATALPGKIVDRKVTIKFDANVSKTIHWDFKPEKFSETIKLGQQGLISFEARNKDDKPTVGSAVFNVTPERAGQYFHKIQCFCFTEQTLAPHQEMQMPVVFYVDPKMADDVEMKDVSVITLSYTFYPANSEELDKATEAFYNSGKD